MNDSKQCIGKCHTRQTLCIVHGITFFHVSVIRAHKISLDHLDRMQGKRIGKITVRRGNIRLDGMRHRIHTGMRYQLLRHRLCKLRIHDRHIWRNLKICNRIFDSFFIIRNDGKCRHFRRRSGCGRDRAEMCFFAELRNSEYLAHIFKRNVRIFILDPHCLCRINRRAAAHRHDPVRLEFFHCLGALHHRLHRWIRLNSLKQTDLHSCFFQILLCAIQKSKTLHGTSADTDHRALSLKIL